jgi:hypothetical protein
VLEGNVQVITGDFETMILDGYSSGGGSDMDLDSATDYDDEVGPNGEIDIGEIAAQYFSLEMY